MPIEVAVPVVLFGFTAALSAAVGAFPERAGALILVAWLLLERLYHLFVGPGFFTGALEVYIALDVLAFVGFGALALTANRVWPLVATSLQTIALLGHLAVWLGVPGEAKAYWTMTQLPPLLMALVVIAGTILHSRRSRRIGPYRNWRRKAEPRR
jgi:hypothetical protein